MNQKWILAIAVSSIFAAVGPTVADTRSSSNDDQSSHRTLVLDSQYSTTDVNGPSVYESRTNLDRSKPEYVDGSTTTYQDPRGRFDVVVCTGNECSAKSRYYSGTATNEDVKRNLDGDSYFSDK